MQTQEAAAALAKALDIGPTEGALYVHLCLAGPAKAADLAGALHLHRNEVYRSASRLLQRGFVEMTMERPARFAAVPPARVFDAESAARVASLEALRAARDLLIPLLERPSLEGVVAHRSTYKLIQGREEIFALRDRLVDEAKTSIAWATSFAASIPLTDVTGGIERIARRVDAGVRFRGLFQPGARAHASLRELGSLPGAEVREMALGADVRFFVFDDEQLLMWVVNDPSEALHARDEVAIHTTAPGFVQAESVFFEQLWANASPGAKPRASVTTAR